MSRSRNFLFTLVAVTFDAADTETAITHELRNAQGVGIIPRGHFIVRQNGEGDTYESGTAWTATTAYLKSSAAISYHLAFYI